MGEDSSKILHVGWRAVAVLFILAIAMTVVTKSIVDARFIRQSFVKEFGFHPTEDIRQPLKVAERLEALCWAYQAAVKRSLVYRLDVSSDAYERVAKEEASLAGRRFWRAYSLAEAFDYEPSPQKCGDEE